LYYERREDKEGDLLKVEEFMDSPGGETVPSSMGGRSPFPSSPPKTTPYSMVPTSNGYSRRGTPSSPNRGNGSGGVELFGEGRKVPGTLFKALEERQADNLELEGKVGNLQRTLQEVRFERDELKTRLEGREGTSLNKRDRARLRKALGEVRDYEVYKGVMEQALKKLKDALEESRREEERVKGRLERAEGRGRKGQKEMFELRKKVTRMEGELEMVLAEKLQCQEERDRLKVANGELEGRMKAAVKEVGRLRVENRNLTEEAGAAKRR